MKNFPFIPVIMWTLLMMVIIHGHKMNRKTRAKMEYSMAAGVDAHLTSARKAFIAMDDFKFKKEIEATIGLLTKEAYCDKCIDKEVAKQNLGPLVDIKHQYQRDALTIEDMDKAFGTVIRALAKNHLIYTLENLGDIKDDFYLEDAIRHLKFSMKYVSEEVRQKEEAATARLEEALSKEEFDHEATINILKEVVAGI